MDDLIVIIITLAIMVVGAVGQIKKKKAQEAAPQKEGNAVSEGNFWDVLLQKSYVLVRYSDFYLPDQKSEYRLTNSKMFHVGGSPIWPLPAPDIRS